MSLETYRFDDDLNLLLHIYLSQMGADDVLDDSYLCLALTDNI